MEATPLTPEQRERILSEIHERETLEQQALKEQKAARQAEAERMQHEERARAARQAEAERRENITNLLNSALGQLQKAIAAFSEGDETQAYRLLVRVEENRFSASQRLSRPAERPVASGAIPTLKVRADNPMGYAIINSSDLTPAHEILEDS